MMPIIFLLHSTNQSTNHTTSNRKVCLESLARRWTHVRFLRLKASDTPGQQQQQGTCHHWLNGGDDDQDQDEEARTGRSWRQWGQRGSSGGDDAGEYGDFDNVEVGGGNAPAATLQTARRGTTAFDEDTLPVLIVYRGGVVVGSVVRASDELATQRAASSQEGWIRRRGGSELFGVDDVELLLSQKKAIDE